MTEFAPLGPIEGGPRRPDRRIVVTLAVSLALHGLVLAWLLIPRIAALPPPDDPINVEVVRPSFELPSIAPTPSSAPLPEPAAEKPPPPEPAKAASSEAPPVPMEKPQRLVIPVGPADASASSASAASEAASDAASSAEASTAASEPASTPASSAASDASGASSAETSTSASAEASSAASEAGVSALATAGTASDSAAAPEPATPPKPAVKPVGGGKLRAARQFYLRDMLRSPSLAQAGESLKSLSPERRLAQTCNIEAVGQIGHAGDYTPDAIIANAFAPPTIAGTTYGVSGGAFRSAGSWYRIAYDCTLNAAMTSVTSFSFHIGADVTAEMTARLGGG